jgi:hypothetical protein
MDIRNAFEFNGFCDALELLANRRMHVDYDSPEWKSLSHAIAAVAGIGLTSNQAETQSINDPYKSNPYYQER